MPTSFYSSLTDVMTIIMALDPAPQRILDVGIGMGKYGLLCREYLTYFRRPEQRTVESIDGIEARAANVTPLQKHVYDKILVGDLRAIVPTLRDEAYDLAMMMDVIEHLEKAEGLSVLRELQRAARVVLVSTPSFYYEQGNSATDAYAKHRSFWSSHDLERAGAFFILKGEATIAVFAPAQSRKYIRRKFEILRVSTRFTPAWLRPITKRLRQCRLLK